MSGPNDGSCPLRAFRALDQVSASRVRAEPHRLYPDAEPPTSRCAGLSDLALGSTLSSRREVLPEWNRVVLAHVEEVLVQSRRKHVVLDLAGVARPGRERTVGENADRYPARSTAVGRDNADRYPA